MLTWLRALFGHQPASRRELMGLQDGLEGLESRVAKHYQELKDLRGRVYAMKRWEKPAEDAPGEANEEQAAPQHSAPRAPPSTVHLARRFRIGG